MSRQAEWARKRYARDPEFRKRRLATQRRHRIANREKFNERSRRKNLKSYGITLEDYDALLAQQDGLCALCKKKFDARLCVDHCHTCGKVRGLLCRKCNTGLGCYDDSGSLMSTAIAYVGSACGCNHGK